jgi:hypothetical protein
MRSGPQPPQMSGAEEPVENGAVNHNGGEDRHDGFPAHRPTRRPQRRRRPKRHGRHVQASGDLLALSVGHLRSNAQQAPGQVGMSSLSAPSAIVRSGAANRPADAVGSIPDGTEQGPRPHQSAGVPVPSQLRAAARHPGPTPVPDPCVRSRARHATGRPIPRFHTARVDLGGTPSPTPAGTPAPLFDPPASPADPPEKAS